ncbi:MAG TPA: pyruvate kinase [Bacteroides sp.]|nr:pyruvate kinase [Bacteroides sp.]
MRQERSHTKIVATIGPASSSREVLEKMFHEGVDVCRINFSHGSHEEHLKVIDTIHLLNEEMEEKVAILADLQGPKLRVGEIAGGEVTLVEGSEFSFVTVPCTGNDKEAYISYEQLPWEVKTGEKILVDDGKLVFLVLESNLKDRVTTRVIEGGLLSNRKGVNLPDTHLTLPGITDKDREDARFALEHHVDWIALSFVRKEQDVLDLKKILEEHPHQVHVMAKIEKPEALREIDGIIRVADGIMVARGDLGVEVEFHRVPMIQKNIIQKCTEQSKPVIVATQMMESMVNSPTPTRAEATDVANAVLDGADAVMLSAETSVGRFPVQTIRNMQKIINSTEIEDQFFFRLHAPLKELSTFLADSICYNAVMMAKQVNAAAIITLTHSGYTAFRISSHRPRAPIFTFTMNRELIRHLSLVWGVRTFYFRECDDVDEYIDYTVGFLVDNQLLHKGDLVVHVGSIPILEKGKTNMLKLSHVT